MFLNEITTVYHYFDSSVVFYILKNQNFCRVYLLNIKRGSHKVNLLGNSTITTPFTVFVLCKTFQYQQYIALWVNFSFVTVRTRSTICTCIIFSFPCTLIQCFKIFIFAISCLLLRIVQHLAKNLLASTQMPHVMEYEHIKSNHLLFSEL